MRHILLVVAALVAAATCQARTIYVDVNGTGDYPTIQDAVNDSNEDDVIILRPGIYTGPRNRNINSNGKSITVQSIDPCDPAIVAATVIDCQRMGRGFAFLNGEHSLLAGLTITNGRVLGLYDYGDAICSENSSPTILNCVIKKCSGFSPMHSGIAIECYRSNINLTNCAVTENLTLGVDIYDSNADIMGCTINKNILGIYSSASYSPPNRINWSTVNITDSAVTGNAGGISCRYTDMTITRSTISDNNEDSGIVARDSNTIITDSIIRRNKSVLTGIPQYDGGGVLNIAEYINTTIEISRCDISDNTSILGGGIGNSHGTVLIGNCTITNNTAGGLLSGSNQYIEGKGGGIYDYGGRQLTIENCTISGNKTIGNPNNPNPARYGGGICSEDNLIPMLITNSSILDNSAVKGGGVYCEYFINLNNCFLANNEAKSGGGVSNRGSPSYFVNCTFSGNRAVYGGGINGQGVASNCIFWDEEILTGQSSWTEIQGIGVSYSNVRGFGPGITNIDVDPQFTFENDGHLLPVSPCIDAGTNTPSEGLPATDLDGNPRVVDGDSDGLATADMGAFEFNSALSRLAVSDYQLTFSCAKNGPNPEPQDLKIRNCNGGTVNWEIIENCSWLNLSSHSGTSSGRPSVVTIAPDVNQFDAGTYQADMLVTSPDAAGGPKAVRVILHISRSIRVPQDFYTIQSAVDEANDGDWVLVADGVYTGQGNRDIDFRGKAITVRSLGGPNMCVIDCNGTQNEPHSAFIFHNYETNDSILDGFTIINGSQSEGEGGAIFATYANPTINNCLFHNNTAKMGGALCGYESSPWKMIPMPLVINRCSFIDNSAKDGGGAIFCRCLLKLTDCNFIRNYSERGPQGGGGICLGEPASASITNCNFSENFTMTQFGPGRGGAISAMIPKGSLYISNSSFINNRAYDSGGISFLGYNMTLSNSVFSGNLANRFGAFTLNGTHLLQFTNCTIAGNYSIYDGEAASRIGGPVKILNCILSDNDGMKISNPTQAIVTFSNVRGGYPGEGNIDADPRFVRPGYWVDANDANTIVEPNDPNAVWVDGDYHLLPESQCINTGEPNYIPVPNETDLDGNRRVTGGRIDMGAYEYLNTSPVANAGPNQVVYAWIDGIAEVTLDGSASYDADGDLLTYLWKWSIDGNTYDTNGVNPTIGLSVGVHTIELVVNDGFEDSEPNEVTINVVEPIEGSLWVVPRIINGRCGRQRITAILRLPRGITKDQIDGSRKLLLYPGEIEASFQVISRYHERRTERVFIIACFDASSLIEAVGSTGPVQIDVVGQLKTGQYFYGSDTVRIINPPRRPHRRWWDWSHTINRYHPRAR
jgi:predicted outer membrane repeat protein